MASRVQLADQVLQQVQLGRDLGAADDADDRLLRIAQRGVERVQFAPHGFAGIGGDVVGDAFGRGVGAVGGREGVVDVEVAQIRQLLGEDRIIGLFRRVEAHVLQQDHAAGVQIANGLHGVGPMQSSAKRTGAPSSSSSGWTTGFRLIDGTRWPLGRSKWASKSDLGARVAQALDRRQGDPQTGVVRDLAALHRDVEVHADQGRLAGEILGVVEGAEGHGRFPVSSRSQSDGEVARRACAVTEGLWPRVRCGGKSPSTTSWSPSPRCGEETVCDLTGTSPSPAPCRSCGSRSPIRCRTS
jgi:hypothetical protein